MVSVKFMDNVYVLALMSVGLWVASRVFWSRARGPEVRRRGPTGWPASCRKAPSWRKANRRAEALLTEILTADQVRALKKTGYLTVPSPNYPARVYYIPRQPGYVTVYEDGRQAFRLCVQPCERLPAADRILQYKLMIEGDEERYLAIAKRLSFF